MNNFTDFSKRFLRQNGPTILTCFGTLGVLATTILTVRATTKAVRLIDAAQIERGDEPLSRIEVIQCVGKEYLPTIMIGTASIMCIFGANYLNKRQQASLISAYTLINSSYSTYRNKLIELYGEDADQKIIDDIAVEIPEDIEIHSECLCQNLTQLPKELIGNTSLFYDEYSERYFESTIEKVILAEYHLNRNYILRGYAELNEFYMLLGLTETEYGSVVGWSMREDEMYWIDFNHRRTVLSDGRVCYAIRSVYTPDTNIVE